MKITEDIEVRGYGKLAAETNGESVYDKIEGYGDSQAYSRELALGDQDESLKSAYTYRNSENIKDINVSGRYQVGLIMPGGVSHSLNVQSDYSINSSNSVSYVNGDIESGKSYNEIDAINANLSESVKDYSTRVPMIVAATSASGNLTLVNELEDSKRTSCNAGVLLEKLDSVAMKGSNQVKEIQMKGPMTIIVEGKEVSSEAQASYLQNDAANLINTARTGSVVDVRGTFEEALVIIDKALEIYSEDSNGWTNKGYVLYKLNRTGEAEEAYDEAIKLDSENVAAIFGMAEVLFKKEQYRESLKYYDQGLRLAPDKDPDYWFNKADAHDKLDEYPEAIASINKYLSYNEGDLDGLIFKAELLYENNNSTEAISVWRDVIERSPENDPDLGLYHYNLGLAYLKVDSAKAIENFEKAKVLDGTLAEDADEKIKLAGLSPAKPQTSSAVSNPIALAGINNTQPVSSSV